MCKYGTLSRVKVCKPKDPDWSYNKQQESKGRRVKTIDSCIAPLVQTLNDFKIETVQCCCTHHKANWSSIWVHPRHIVFKGLGFTKTWEKILLIIAGGIIKTLANNKRIEMFLKFPSPKFKYSIKGNRKEIIVNSKYKARIRSHCYKLEDNVTIHE